MAFIPISDSAPLIGGGAGVPVGAITAYLWMRLKSGDYRSALDLWKAKKLAWRYDRQYFSAYDYEATAGDLLHRAQRAVRDILRSQVHKDGLLDAVANEMILDQRIQELAEALFDQSTLHWEQQAAARNTMTPELKAVLGPQRKALQGSIKVIGGQVKKLEEYAQRVAIAESVYAAHRLMLSNDAYEALLTRVHDTEGVAQLTGQAHEAKASLSASLKEAIEAGQALTTPG